MNLSTLSTRNMGLLQASGIAAYCSMIGVLFWKGEMLFGDQDAKFFAPVSMLLLLSLSVLVCAIIVLYRPYILFFDGKKKAAADLVVSTAGWLVLFVIIFFSASIAL